MSTSPQRTTLSHSGAPESDRWFSVPVRRSAPLWRLVCFPHAGGGASVYFSWAKYLAQREVELWSVRYPGRENRLADPPVREFTNLVQPLTEALRPLGATGVPLAFFGHSMGAMLAHEVACELFRQGGPLPVALFLSGRNAPGHRCEPIRLNDLPPGELLDALAEFGNLPEAVRNEPSLVELLMPALRADLALLDDYDQHCDARQVVPLNCQLSVFCGDQDPWTHTEGLAQWRQFVRGRFRLRTYVGGHFFLNEYRQNIWQAIVEDLNGRSA